MCYIGRCWVTWEFLERQVGIGVVARTADDRIKYMTFLLSILALGQDLPLPTTGVVWSLFDTLYQGLSITTLVVMDLRLTRLTNQ